MSRAHRGGFIPKRINNSITVPQVAHSLMGVQLVFTSIRPSADVTDGDAKELGHLLLFYLQAFRGRNKKEQLHIKILELMEEITVLREAKNAHPWLDVLLLEVLRNRVRVPKGTNKPLVEYTEGDARKAGRAFANALIANATAEAAVDEWVKTYPALGELEQRGADADHSTNPSFSN
jgi:hypothetical protein